MMGREKRRWRRRVELHLLSTSTVTTASSRNGSSSSSSGCPSSAAAAQREWRECVRGLKGGGGGV